MHSLKDRENLQKILGRKVDLAVRGERIAHQKVYHAEAEAKIGKREILILLFRRSINNLKLSNFNYFQQVDGQIVSERLNYLV